MLTMVRCAGCDQPIYDRYLSHVIDKTWHASCLICWVCKSPLNDKCYTRDGNLYCKSDFYKRFASKCARCNQVISANDLVRRAQGKIFHVDCFCCMVCQKRLDTGEELYVINGCKFICKGDYCSTVQSQQAQAPESVVSECGSDEVEEEDLSEDGKSGVETAAANVDTSSELNDSFTPSEQQSVSSPDSCCSQQQQSKSDDNVSGSASSQLNSAKRRGPRTTIKAKQLETLKAAFAATPKPTRHIREQLAQETGLNMRVIQVWFQNRRSKERRIKQLRFGAFRPGSRRSRNTLIRGDAALNRPCFFADGISRLNDSYYNHPIGYYCDMYPPNTESSAAASAAEMVSMQTLSNGFMIRRHEDSLCPVDSRQTADGSSYLMSDADMRPLQTSPDMVLNGNGADDATTYRAHPNFNASLAMMNSKQHEHIIPSLNW